MNNKMAYLVVYFAPPGRGADSTASHLITRQSLLMVINRKIYQKVVFEFALFKRCGQKVWALATKIQCMSGHFVFIF
jgi:hypothetical protein